MYEIKNRFNDNIIYKSENADNVTEAVREYIDGLKGKFADLSSANLSGADLHGANLSGAFLHVANLSGADLHGAFLHGANLSRANLSSANLSGADLRYADMASEDLRCANLSGADLRYADMAGAFLSSADLSSACLHGANLFGAFLHGANLSGADLRYANLAGANLSFAKLSGTMLAWFSHDLIAEVLRRSADKDVAKLKVSGLILTQRDWCWKEFCSLDEPQEIVDWAMGTLSKWAWEDDHNVPTQLLEWMEKNGIPKPKRS